MHTDAQWQVHRHIPYRAWDLGLLQEDAGKLQDFAHGQADGTIWITLHVGKTASAFDTPSLQAALWMLMTGQKSLNFCYGVHRYMVAEVWFSSHSRLAAVPSRLTTCDTRQSFKARGEEECAWHWTLRQTKATHSWMHQGPPGPWAWLGCEWHEWCFSNRSSASDIEKGTAA